MADFLASMADSSRERAAVADRTLPARPPQSPINQLRPGGFDVIAEIKERSPAEGDLVRSDASRVEQAQRYAAGGAVAISVLTEPSRFSGSLDHLSEVAAAVPDTPVMRKDFLVDTIQLHEARHAGASGALLIAAMLDDDELRTMLDCAIELGLFILLETFDSDDLQRSKALLDIDRYAALANDDQLLIGVNTRNLRTLKVDADRLRRLAPQLPGNARCVAESGLHGADDAAIAAGLGYRMALVGTALMRSDNPAALVSAMRAAGAPR